MKDMINQLTLGVGLKDSATFANYIAGNNSQLLQELEKTAQGCGERIIYFYGAGGQGCTHLLQACCHESNLKNLSSAYIPLDSLIEYSPDIFDGLETLKLICIDDLHKLAGKPKWEEAFFHAFNRIRDAGGNLIMTGNTAPKSLGLQLPDLESRLSWGMVFQMQPLTDDEKLHALITRAKLRGMTLPDEVGKFILTHCPRHMATLFAALDVLDKVSLAAQRKLTIPFVKAVLEI